MKTLTNTQKKHRKHVRENVARGAALLDRAMPTWFKKIDLKTLDLSTGKACVCGQLAMKSRSQYVKTYMDDGHGGREPTSGYRAFRNYLANKFGNSNDNYGETLFALNHGFAARCSADYATLDREWARIIRRRLREAEATR